MISFDDFLLESKAKETTIKLHRDFPNGTREHFHYKHDVSYPSDRPKDDPAINTSNDHFYSNHNGKLDKPSHVRDLQDRADSYAVGYTKPNKSELVDHLNSHNDGPKWQQSSSHQANANWFENLTQKQKEAYHLKHPNTKQ